MVRAGVGCVRVGETVKRGWSRKEGRGNKKFKKERGKLGHGMGALKREGWNPLTNYELRTHSQET